MIHDKLAKKADGMVDSLKEILMYDCFLIRAIVGIKFMWKCNMSHKKKKYLKRNKTDIYGELLNQIYSKVSE